MNHKLVDEFKALEDLGFAFIKSLWGGCPCYGVGNRIIVDFLGTGRASNHILSQGFTFSLAEQSGFALDTETGMLLVFKHVHSSLADQFFSQKQR